MAIITLEECRKLLPKLNHLPDSEIIKIRDNLTQIINSLLGRAFKDHKRKIADIKPAH